MTIALGAFDPKTSPAEAYRMLCLAIPDLPQRVAEMEREIIKNSILAHFIPQGDEK